MYNECTRSFREEQEVVVTKVLVVGLETVVPEERLERPDLMVPQDDPEALDQSDQLVIRDSPESKDHRDHQESLDLPEPRETR